MWHVWSGIGEGFGCLEEVTCEDLSFLQLAYIMDRNEGVEGVWGGRRRLWLFGGKGEGCQAAIYQRTRASYQTWLTSKLACRMQGAGGVDAECGRVDCNILYFKVQHSGNLNSQVSCPSQPAQGAGGADAECGRVEYETGDF